MVRIPKTVRRLAGLAPALGLLVGLILAPANGGAVRGDGQGPAALKRGKQLLDAHDDAGALAALGDAVRLMPDEPLARAYRAEALRRMRRFDEALADADEAVRLAPRSASARAERANVRASRDEPWQALADADEAVRLGAADPEAHLARAAADTACKEYTKALADCDEALRLDPNSAAAHNDRGVAHAGRKEYEQALADYAEATRLDPRFAAPCLNRGAAYASQRKHDQAVDAYTEALRLDPHSAPAFFQRGWAHAARKDYDQAIADYAEALRLDPAYADAYQRRAEAYQAKGDKEHAEADLAEQRRLTAPPAADDMAGLTPDQQKRLAEARQLGQGADSLTKQGKHADAVAALEKRLEIVREVFGKDDLRTAPSVEKLAQARQDADDFDGARAAWHEAIDLRTARQGDKHWRVVDARLGLAHTERLARLTAEQRRRLAKAAKQMDQSGALFNKGVESAKALDLARQALQTRRELLADDDPDCAAALNNVGMLSKRMGDYLAAVGPLQEALALRKRLMGEEHPACALSLTNLGLARYALGDYGRAEPLLRQAAEMLAAVADPHDLVYVTALNNLGVLYTATGDRDQAATAFARALDACRLRAGAGEPASFTDAASWPGVSEAATAELYWSLAFLGTYAPPPNRRHTEATCLNNLGLVRLVQGDAARADAHFRQALDTMHQLKEEGADLFTSALNNLALSRELAGDHAAAEDPLRLVVTRREPKGNGQGDAMLYANALSNLGLLDIVLGRADEAEPLLRKALALRKAAVPNHPSVAVGLDNLAVLAQVKGDAAAADADLQEALAVARRNLALAAVIQSERQQLALVKSLRGYLDHYLSLPAGDAARTAAAYEQVLAWKGSVLLRQKRQRDQTRVLADGRSQEVAALAADLEETSRRLANIALSTMTGERVQKRVEELTRHKEKLEQNLSRLSAEFRRQQEETPLDAAALQKLLPDDAVLIDYLEYTHFTPPDAKGGVGATERRLTAFVVARGKEIRRVDLGPAAAVEQEVDRWREAWGRTLPGKAEPGPKLRSLVWEPLREAIDGARTVLVSPDGALGRFPLHALPGAKPNNYLCEDVALGVVAAPQFLPELLAAGPPPADADARPSLLLVGDVDYGADPGAPKESGPTAAAPAATRGKTLADWPSLKGTAEEIDALKAIYSKRYAEGKLVVLRGKEATEERFREEAPACRWLHVATHGFFAPPELRSALAGDAGRPAAGGDADPFGRGGVAGFHPGLLCGVVLAGANHPPEPARDDGILTAAEAAVIDLRRTDLAVLSACETQLGEAAGGEGMLGLQRALQLAGARTVVASLWQVPDEPTRVLMARFYGNLWDKKMSRLEALREAQVWMLREGRTDAGVQRGVRRRDPEEAASKDGRLPPYYWAAFVLSGDWR